MLFEAAEQRGEMIANPEQRGTTPDLSHAFFGHELREGASFSVGTANGLPRLAITVTAADPAFQGELFGAERESRLTFGLQIEGS